MDNSLRVLIVEDSEDDALLIIRELRKEGYAPYYERVDTADAFLGELKRQVWDLVITDHNMPSLDSATVLSIVKKAQLDIPVIIVSGIITEDTAIEAMKAGAQDYIMKDNLARLIPAIQRELGDAEVRKAKRRAEKTINHMAYHDSLTNLVNRTEFETRIQAALDTSRTRGQTHAVLYLDLDKFKYINETCGYVAGDTLLRQLSHELKKQIREGDTLARLGGDEFGVLLENCPPVNSRKIANQFLNSVNDFRFAWQSKKYKISVSIGFMELNSETTKVDDVLSAVDVACYMAKEQGRNRVKVYSVSDHELVRKQGDLQWDSHIDMALQENHFELYKQAIVSVKNEGDRQYCEFLLRLNDKDGTILLPGEFIPAAERYNLMPSIDRWVIKAVCDYISETTNGKNNPYDNVMYFINVSGSSLQDNSIYDYISDQLQEHNIPADIICFEISESEAITLLNCSIDFIGQIHGLGCKVALDDFGAGLTSFSYLKSFDVDFIKIDGGFINHIKDEPMDYAIVDAINHIGHIAGIQTIAELVESQATMDKLRDIGVDFVQGYSLDHQHPVKSTYLSANTA